MLEDLEKYYRLREIYSEDFQCKHYKACSRGCEERFTEAKSAFIGTQYEQGILPRLLFLSSDSGESDKNPKNRTPYYVRLQTEQVNGQGIGRYLHWRETHQLAVKLLSQFGSWITMQNVTPYFCHVNSAKCCMNNPGNKQASRILFQNCREYLLNELVILKPDIIVSQGRESADSLHKILVTDATDLQLDTIRKVMISGRSVLWISTYHPHACKRYWNQKQHKWNDFALAVANFIKK